MSAASRAVSERKVDCVHWRLWLVQVFCLAVVCSMFMVALVAGSSKSAGYPCFYGAVVDYEDYNASETSGLWNKLGAAAPVLFMEMVETVFFFYFVALVMLAVMCYVIAGSLITGRELRRLDSCVKASHMAYMLASPSCLVSATIAVWALQAVVHLLSHKLIVLAGAMYIVHFILLVIFYVQFFGRGVSSNVYADEIRVVKSENTSLYRLTGPGRAVMTNVVSGMVGVSTVMVALMIEVIVANSFTVTMWQSVTVAVVLFVIVAVVYLILSELVVAHYVHVLICPQLGVLVACSAIGVSGNGYLKRFAYAIDYQAPYLEITFKVLLSILALMSIMMLVIRVVRAYLYHRRNVTAFYGHVNNVRGKVKGFVEKRRGMKRAAKRSAKRDSYSTVPLTTTPASYQSDDEITVYENVGYGSNEPLYDSDDWDESDEEV
ncbi:envelope glycoprotein M [Spheniscid alphaherpesvirus 1]|uniref:Envelope glycoprotein M n=1 Tax=Spheniscid alphaherpesvirus 1 TaxID=2560777 RepID=A0A1R3TAZ7_9ALPH|nr:envelope glycoprotein M [Spheniscid alphaherpesvirus 1]SCO83590.1 envelope glycoprotein M [Spheniscid alphaherpesvirus 1]